MERVKYEVYEEGLQNIFSAAGGVTIDNYISSRQDKEMRQQIYAIVNGLWSIFIGEGWQYARGMVSDSISDREKENLHCAEWLGFLGVRS